MHYVIRQVAEQDLDDSFYWYEAVEKHETVEEATAAVDLYNAHAFEEEYFFVGEEERLFEYCLQSDAC